MNLTTVIQFVLDISTVVLLLAASCDFSPFEMCAENGCVAD